MTFKHPQSGTYTNSIEGNWSQIKCKLSQKYRRQPNDGDIFDYLRESMNIAYNYLSIKGITIFKLSILNESSFLNHQYRYFLQTIHIYIVYKQSVFLSSVFNHYYLYSVLLY